MSSQRTGFVLDAKSMGLKGVSSPPSPPSTNCLCEPCPEPEEDCPSVGSATQVLAREEGSELEACGSNAQCNSSTEALPTEYYRSLLQKLIQEAGDAGQVNFELNSIFLKRLGEIDGLNEDCGDTMFSTQLRLVTFQEWVDFLLHVNSVILGNMSELEDEAYSKIVSYFNSMQGQQQQALDENRKLRRDLCTLIKFVQTGYHRSSWEGIKEVSLETMTVNQLLGMKPDQVLPESESEKMAECMKSLVNEMAEKHDEIVHLKTQLANLDEVVLTARQKLLFKDQCIAQLNQQLQEVTQKLASMPTTDAESSAEVTDNPEQTSGESKVDATTSISITNCMLQDLAIQDYRETEMLRILDNELNEFLLMHNIHEHQTMESWRRRLACLYEKLSSERDDTVKKLENIRSQLSLLQADVDRSGLVFNHPPPSTVDVDSKMVECLRGRMDTLTQRNRELQEKYLRLDTETKILQTKFEFQNGLNERNSHILKEIADFISKLLPIEFSYQTMYSETSTENPFCEAIKEILDRQRSSEELRNKTCNERLACQIQGLQDTVKDRDGQIADLQSMIQSYSDVSENNRLKEQIHELKLKNSNQGRQIRELEGAVKSNEQERRELASKYQNLMSSLEEKSQGLKGAERQVEGLQTRLNQLEQLQGELQMERNVLRDEVVALKEKEAVSAGRERALVDQQRLGHMELEKMRHHIRDMQCQLQQEESQHRENVRQLEKTKVSIQEKMSVLSADCQRMQMRLKQQFDVNQQQGQIIESFRKWKEAQVRSDDAMRQRAKEAENKISMLVEENQSLVKDYRCVYRDYQVLEQELQRVKQAINYAPTSSMGYPPSPSGRMDPEAGNEMSLQNYNKLD
ncbi:putative leucine-rich repeat-containing protein DDB_G0290503 isoform X2 [Drosophila kikkawai]|uniref:Leucine-rich repeat-containing protein DDB_G0290503 isoform X2 n=1 Tax=Drosophila kikkawai TaxID=30033 RepID=A0ABM4GJA5_DROKI